MYSIVSPSKPKATELRSVNFSINILALLVHLLAI
jgi:hypothetical protein